MKLCFISDTHNLFRYMIENNYIPKCDYLFHSGDLTITGTYQELLEAIQCFKILKEKKIVKKEIICIAGNHDKLLEENKYIFNNNNFIYLENNQYIIENDIIVYGTPVTSPFKNYSFMKNFKEIKEYWNKIPKNTNILLTHNPPFNILDKNFNNKNCGCKQLLEKINSLDNLKIHSYGHIHESYGEIIINNKTFLNSSIINYQKKIFNKPHLINL